MNLTIENSKKNQKRKQKTSKEEKRYIEKLKNYGYGSLEHLISDAKQGNSEAQWDLGMLYSIRGDTTNDYTQALYWYKKSAEQGYARAENSLGRMYKLGEGVKQDRTQAIHWYRKAATQGHEIAQKNLKDLDTGIWTD